MNDKQKSQKLVRSTEVPWDGVAQIPGLQVQLLAEPVEQGSIHRAKLSPGTVIPPHTHPSPEYATMVSGSLKCPLGVLEKGAFWTTPAGVKQGPYEAVGDVELFFVRLGPMGQFDNSK